MKKQEIEKIQSDGFIKEKNDSWKCFWVHKWSKWSEPYWESFFTFINEEKIKTMQKRICLRCNLVEAVEV